MEFPALLEVMPTFTNYEKERFLNMSSLEFNNFFRDPDLRNLPDSQRVILFKANKILDCLYEQLMHDDQSSPLTKIKLFRVMLRWGHISLLAQDWAKALSAYQYAFRLHKNHFWKDPGAYFGLGLVYAHFKEYKMAANAFGHLIYSYPTAKFIIEAKVRLAMCYQNLSQYKKALKFYNQSLLDKEDTPFMSRVHIRFNIALCRENAGQLAEAMVEYKDLLEEINNTARLQGNQFSTDQIKLVAAINRQLGWISYLNSRAETPENRGQHLQEAEQFLHAAKNYEQSNGKTFYFLGRCYGDLANKAHEAFVNYRQSIDKSEANADTWCSIGWLYQQQNQPMDALQAFICAVELDSEHTAAWTDLGRLFEIHNQFEDALSCFKNAIKFNSVAPEALKARIEVLEKEIQSSSHFPAGQPRTSAPIPKTLPSLKDAWNQPIPSELRQRQDEFLRQKHQRYRDGSPLWKMGELAAPLEGIQESLCGAQLESTQLQMMRLLQMNKDRINDQEKKVLEQLENIHRRSQEPCVESLFLSHSISSLPQFSEEDLEKVKAGDHLLVFNNNIKLEDDEKETVSKYEEDIAPVQDDTVSSPYSLPNVFSLQSKLNVPIDISSTELLAMCHKRQESLADYKPIFEENVQPPMAPDPPFAEPTAMQNTTGVQNHPLLRPTPLVMVESRKDAHSPELQKFCENTPIALIRNLTSVLKMDLSLFSTKTLREVAPEHEVEVRTQYKMPCDLNVDQLGTLSWACTSQRSFTTVNKYAQYQAETFQHSLKEEAEKLRSAGAKYAQQIADSGSKRRRGPNGEEFAMPTKQIKFGTNVDLSDDTKWKTQLNELAKMPPFCRLISGSNMLSHLGHNILGMNTVQLYMKVPGSRTPAHQENNSFASININIGPGDCEWFGVPHEYWGKVDLMCRARDLDFLKGSYWPIFEDLVDAGIPVYRFTQKAGDLVWVGGGCVHWVQATGWCNNIAWNVGPLTHNQISMSIAQYEWNKLQEYKSLVPMQHLCWQLAKNIKFTNQNIYNLVRGQLIRSLAFCKMVSDWAMSTGNKPKAHPRSKGEITHYCTLCEVEVFNILFVKEFNDKFHVYCAYCTNRSRLTDYYVLQQITFVELNKIFDEMQLHLIPKSSLIC